MENEVDLWHSTWLHEGKIMIDKYGDLIQLYYDSMFMEDTSSGFFPNFFFLMHMCIVSGDIFSFIIF